MPTYQCLAKAILLSSLLICNLFAGAQKLPTVQINSVVIPANIKIDGKATEWDNKLEAYNSSTNIFYTIANNNDNLYLIVQSKDERITKKLIGGGLTFTISLSGKKQVNGNPSVMFPLMNTTTTSKVAVSLNQLSEENNYAADSIIEMINHDLLVNAKEIALTDIHGSKDSLISIYNKEGIKVALLVKSKGIVTYQLLVPLKYFGLDMKTDKILYNVTLNGLGYHNPSVIHQTPTGVVTVTTIPHGMTTGSGDFELLQYPTNFWAEYVLVKQ